MNRSQRRMKAYNEDKALEQGWAFAVEAAEYVPPAPKPAKQSQRSQAWKSRARKEEESAPPRSMSDPKEMTAGIKKMSVETLKEEPLYSVGPWGGTKPVTNVYAQNLDFSTFTVLVEAVYNDLESVNSRLRRELPFCAFQHTCTSVLNAVVIDHIRSVNKEDRYSDEESPINLIPDDMVLPVPIIEYCVGIANTTAPQGETIYANIPDGGVPQGIIPAVAAARGAEAAEAIPSGSFGRLTPENHNAYECYVSPFITSALVLRTRNQQHAAQEWQPLPAGAYPAGTFPNRNLLGYRTPERLTGEGLNVIEDFDFPNDNTMAGRLRWCPELNSRVSNVMHALDGRYKMHRGKPRTATSASGVGWLRVGTIGLTPADHNRKRLAEPICSVRSSVALGASQSNFTGLMGLKRERTATARGLCYTTAEGVAPHGWEGTINANFTMVAPFQSRIGVDNPALRVARHISASPTGSRVTVIRSWCSSNFLIKK